jgi:hypothetical protein
LIRRIKVLLLWLKVTSKAGREEDEEDKEDIVDKVNRLTGIVLRDPEAARCRRY